MQRRSYSRSVFPWKRARRSSRRSKPALVETTQPLELWSAKLFEQVSFGLQRSPMRRNSFAGVRIVSFFAKQIHVPVQALQTIPLSWPFACWGLDMMEPFKPTPGSFHWVYVYIDKFSKWIKYKPLVQATAKKTAELLDDIIHRFGLPNSIITDLGSTFSANF